MIKILFLLRRKPGTTHEQFREHYESSHVKLAQKHFGHLLMSYERNYATQLRARSQEASAAFDYDCITQMVLPGEEALAAFYGVLADTEIGKEFQDDEERFMDRDAVIAITCREDQVVDTGPRGIDL